VLKVTPSDVPGVFVLRLQATQYYVKSQYKITEKQEVAPILPVKADISDSISRFYQSRLEAVFLRRGE